MKKKILDEKKFKMKKNFGWKKFLKKKKKKKKILQNESWIKNVFGGGGVATDRQPDDITVAPC